MNDEILVEYAGLKLDDETEMYDAYIITTTPHEEAFGKIANKDFFNDADLKAFKTLGYAVCHNKLDKRGKKVYIHHNMRTYKENK